VLCRKCKEQWVFAVKPSQPAEEEEGCYPESLLYPTGLVRWFAKAITLLQETVDDRVNPEQRRDSTGEEALPKVGSPDEEISCDTGEVVQNIG
jgi:hypothetical protein